VRATILTSERVNRLTWAAEVMYRRLFSVCDDYGRFDGRPSILRAALFALRLDRVTELNIVEWLAECQAAGLLIRYTVDDKPYIEVARFGQRMRAAKSKFPHPRSSADICQQPLSDSAVFGDVFGNGIETAPDAVDSTAPKKSASSRIKFDYHAARFVGIEDEDVLRWQDAHPAIAVPAQIACWLKANPNNRKRNLERFIVGWLGKEQDRAPRGRK